MSVIHESNFEQLGASLRMSIPAGGRKKKTKKTNKKNNLFIDQMLHVLDTTRGYKGSALCVHGIER
jgi:hypothetical protein